MSEFLDELARTVAKPMPRSRALRLLGGALVAVAVPALRPPRAVSATRLVTSSCPVADCPACKAEDTYLCCLPIKGNDGKTRCVGRGCCPTKPDFHICCKTKTTTTCCNSETHACGPPGVNDTATCKCKKPCQGDCCRQDEYCAKGGCRPCDSPNAKSQGFRLCGKQCCNPRESCSDAALGLCCANRESDSPEEACVAVNPIRRQRKGTCCAEGTQCCSFVDDKKNILRVDCCSSGQRCRQGVCV
jgi:hypothetical protein